MKHAVRRTIQLLVLGLVLPLWPAGDVEADPQFAGALRGEYSLEFTRHCLGEATETSTGSGVFQSNSLAGLITIRAAATYDGSGTSTLTNGIAILNWGAQSPGQFLPGQGISTGTGEFYQIQLSISCTSGGTYDVDSQGHFIQRQNCTQTTLNGRSAGTTITLNGLTIEGRLSLDGTVLALGGTHSTATTPNFETIQTTSAFLDGTPLPGPFTPSNRLCKGWGIATARR